MSRERKQQERYIEEGIVDTCLTLRRIVVSTRLRVAVGTFPAAWASITIDSAVWCGTESASFLFFRIRIEGNSQDILFLCPIYSSLVFLFLDFGSFGAVV